MQILSSDNIINTTSYPRVLDLSKNLILETVPYNKVTKTPMPFKNVMVTHYTSNLTYGKKSYNPYYENNIVKDSSNSSNNSYSNNYLCNFNSYNTLVDNNDSSITYAISYAGYIYKFLETNNDITVQKSMFNSESVNGYNVINYLTQDDNYIYVIMNGNIDTSSSYLYMGRTQVKIYKINKMSLSYSICYPGECSAYNSSDSYISGSSRYTYTYFGIKNCKVLKETENGLILLCTMCYDKTDYYSQYPNYSNNIDNAYLSYEHKFYSFDTGKVTRITPTLDSSTSTKPYSSCWNSYGSLNSSCKLDKIAIPSDYLETDNTYYGYIYAGNDYSTTVGSFSLYRIEQNKNDVLSSTIYKTELVFPQESTIQSIPHYTSGSWFSSYGVQTVNLVRYETQAFNIEGTDYINIWFESVFNKAENQIGCYTFKVNQDKTQATFISFYPAVGGQLNGFMPLNNSGTKILVTTPTSYHIMMFDATSEEWKTTYEETTTIVSCIQTDDDKIYFTTSDKRVICQDLEGATTIDFTFEQTSYQYNDTDITTYIQLWSKNSEDEYVETTVKLTLQGNAVWQSNGLQTLTITTSDEGKINVPFVIKGQSTINVSVDVVL